MIATLPDGFQIIHGWRSDGRAYDPSTKVLIFSYQGEVFEATNRLGPGWPMVIRTARQDSFGCASVDWENWTQAIGHIDSRH